MAPIANALVVDASVAVKWHLLDEEYTDEASLLLARFAQGQANLWVPDYIYCEVPAAITMATRGRQPRLTSGQGREAIAEFLALGLQVHESIDLVLKAYPLVHQYDCAFYDALYLALAQRLYLPLITADYRFYRRIRHLPDVLWIGDYTT
jgi:predicted nucleic acid-binding protein